MSNQNKIFTKRHLVAALLAGTLDITAACIQYYIVTGKNPEGVLRYVASGAFGSDANSGTIMLFWGLLFHFIAAFSFTFIFFTLVSLFPVVLHQKIILAVLYGIFMWAAMRYCVIPLSRINPLAFKLKGATIAVAILIVCICLPLIIVASKEKRHK